MDFKKLLIIGFLLITLVALPVSFAADISVTDLNSNDLGGTNSDLGIDQSDILINEEELDINYTDDNTIYLNASYNGTEEKGTLINPYKNINTAMNAILNTENKTNLCIANGDYTINRHFSIVNKNINVIGESTSGVKINCNEDYLFAFTNSDSNIFNLTIYNAYSNTDYAVIWTNLSNIAMCNVIFTNNLANSPGGIILTQGGKFKLINSSIKNNLIDYDGGISGGIIYSSGTDLSIINSSFINNTIKATTYAGGCIYVKGNLEFINSNINNLYVNATYIEGGFILYTPSTKFDKAYIINSSFERSNFTKVTGLILNYGYLIINNTNMSNNYGESLNNNFTLVNIDGICIEDNFRYYNNTFLNVFNDFSSIMNFLYRNGYFIISEELPDRYDLRDYNLTTIAKNQGSSGSCWSFATIGALESYLLKYWNESFDLSENNLKNIMKKYGINGSEWDPNLDGGNDVLALAYLLRWSGAVNESDDPYDASSISSDLYDALCHVQDVIYIPLRLNYTDNDQIKYAIMNYGAVWTEMHASGVIQQNTYSTECTNSDHAVVIVGWDDNYSASNFAITPPGDGAFIVKNSWGPTWGDDGYFYVSYYDASFAGFATNGHFSGFVFSNVESVDNYNNIYYYDPFGNDYVAVGYLSNTGWFANQFVSNDNEILSAFGIYTYGDSNYSANIYVNDNLVYTQEGAISNAGYHTIKLNQQLGLNKGDIFKIEIKLITPNCLYPIAVEVPHEGFVNATANPNESFVSVDGVNWTDLTELIANANVCIKAYTDNPIYSIEVNATEIKAYVDDIITLNISIKDLSGISKDLSEGNLTIIFPDSNILNYTIRGNEISFTIPNSNVSGDLIIKFSSSDYPTIFANLNLTLLIHNSTLNVSPSTTVQVLEDGNFVINLVDENNNPICEGIVFIYEDGVNVANLTVTNGTVIWNYSYNSTGVYNIGIVYNGNNKYLGSTINRTVTVNKINTNLSLETDLEPTIYILNNGSFTIKLINENNESINGNVIIYDNGVNVANLTLTNGTVIWNYTFESVGEHVISAVYSGNNKYASSNANKTITVNKIPVKMTIKQNNTYYKSAFITITLDKAIGNQSIVLQFSNGKNATVVTNASGVAIYYVPFVVTSTYYTVIASADNSYYDIQPDAASYRVFIKKVTATITAYKLTTTYQSGKYFQIKVTNPKGPMVGVRLKLNVYTGSSYKTVYVTTDSNGIAKLYGSSLSIASHKIVVSSGESTVNMVATAKTNYLVVQKGTTNVVAPVVKNTYKASQYFRITVKNSASGSIISGLAITFKVYTGSSYKTYTVKTNANGMINFNTQALAKGNHKVVITSTSPYYSVSKSGYLISIV